MRHTIHNAFVAGFWSAFWIVILVALFSWMIALPIVGIFSLMGWA